MSAPLVGMVRTPGLSLLARWSPGGVLEIDADAADEDVARVLEDVARYLRTGRAAHAVERRHLLVLAGGGEGWREAGAEVAPAGRHLAVVR